MFQKEKKQSLFEKVRAIAAADLQRTKSRLLCNKTKIKTNPEAEPNLK